MHFRNILTAKVQYFLLSLLNCCFVALKINAGVVGGGGGGGELLTKFVHTFCTVKLAFFLTVYLSGSCFRMLAAILVSDFFFF